APAAAASSLPFSGEGVSDIEFPFHRGFAVQSWHPVKAGRLSRCCDTRNCGLTWGVLCLYWTREGETYLLIPETCPTTWPKHVKASLEHRAYRPGGYRGLRDLAVVRRSRHQNGQ